MKVTLGMSEVLVLSGVYLYSQTFAFSLTLVGLGLLGKLMAMGLEQVAEGKKTESAEKSIRTVVDTIVGAVTNATDGMASRPKNGQFH
jgi:hypothetical protein